MDPYAVLGVDRFATDAEIVRAFRRLALLHHPDRNAGSRDSAARFREVKTAYDSLRARPRARERVAPTPEPPSSDDVGPTPERSGWTSRDLEPAAVERVRGRIDKLGDVVRATLADPSAANVDAVIDRARWARLDVDSALALKGHVADLRDGHWSALRYTDRRAAIETLTAFLETKGRAPDLTAMRNLRARLEGLLAVARGLASDLSRP